MPEGAGREEEEQEKKGREELQARHKAEETAKPLEPPRLIQGAEGAEETKEEAA